MTVETYDLQPAHLDVRLQDRTVAFIRMILDVDRNQKGTKIRAKTIKGPNLKISKNKAN